MSSGQRVADARPSAPGRPEVIRVDRVSKRFTVRKDSSLKERIVTLGRAGRRHREDFWALSDVSLAIHAGTTVGLIGHNGSGKSTLLKVLGGIIQPTSGEVLSRGRVAALLELGAGFHPDLTGRENVYLNASVLGLTRQETDAQFDAILEFSGVADFIDTQVKFYSSGMYVRLAFAIAVHTDPDILLVDEVLAVGDERFQKKCLDKIAEFQEQGRTIIIVSHALDQIVSLCDRVVVMNRGQLVYDGMPASAVTRFRELLEAVPDHRDQLSERSRAMEIERAELRSPDGSEIAQLQMGESFVVRVHVRMIRPVVEWAVGFSVDDSRGQLVLASNSGLLDVKLPPLTESRVVDIEVDGARFMPGVYDVNVNVAGFSEETSDAMMHAVSFSVRGDRPTLGPVAADISLT